MTYYGTGQIREFLVASSKTERLGKMRDAMSCLEEEKF
jgi:hypothetical protein